MLVSILVRSVITAINYILNKSADRILDLDSAISYIMEIIENNTDLFEDLFSMTDVRSGVDLSLVSVLQNKM